MCHTVTYGIRHELMGNVTKQRVNVISGLRRRLEEMHAVTTSKFFTHRRRHLPLSY